MAVTVTNYDTVNGKIRTKWTGERPGSQAVFHDPLGSVVAIYEDGWRKADRVYDASGETRAEWNDVGNFGWVGGYGYRETRREWVSHYVRARHYSYMTGGWTSVDPLWPSEMAYLYVYGRTTSDVDPSGLQAKPPIPPVPSTGTNPAPTQPCNSNNRGQRLVDLKGLHVYGTSITQSSCGEVSVSISAGGSVSVGGGTGVELGIDLGVTGTFSCTCTAYTQKVAYRYVEYECDAPPATKWMPPCIWIVPLTEIHDGKWRRTREQRCEGTMTRHVLSCPGIRPFLLKTFFDGCKGGSGNFNISGYSQWGKP